MPLIPILGKLAIKYLVPMALERAVSWGWNKIFKKNKKDDPKTSNANT